MHFYEKDVVEMFDELMDGLRRRAATAEDMAANETADIAVSRLTGKASAYGHALQIVRDMKQRFLAEPSATASEDLEAMELIRRAADAMVISSSQRRQTPTLSLKVIEPSASAQPAPIRAFPPFDKSERRGEDSYSDAGGELGDPPTLDPDDPGPEES